MPSLTPHASGLTPLLPGPAVRCRADDFRSKRRTEGCGKPRLRGVGGWSTGSARRDASLPLAGEKVLPERGLPRTYGVRRLDAATPKQGFGNGKAKATLSHSTWGLNLGPRRFDQAI